MLSPLLRPGTIIVATLLLVIAAPRISQAYKMTCSNSYDAYLCNDGTIVTCGGIFGPQFDCPDEATLGNTACADHGGLREVVNPSEVVGEAELVADYQGGLRVPPYTGNAAINRSLLTTLNVTCTDGRSFSCVESATCSPPALDAKCGDRGVRTRTTQFAFSPLRTR